MNSTTIGIIGAGPSGLYAAYLASNYQLKTHLFDKQSLYGGKLVTSYPDQVLQNLVGYPTVKAATFIEELKGKIVDSTLEYHLNEEVTSITPFNEGQWLLKSSAGEYICDYIIIASGDCIYWPNEVNLASIDSLASYGIYFSVPNTNIFRDKNVLIVGGNSSAIEWAITANAFTQKVTIIDLLHRFDCDATRLKKLFSSGIDAKPYYELKALLGDPYIKLAVIVNNKTGHEETLLIDTVVIEVGMLGNLLPFHHWGLQIHGNAIRVDNTMKTNLDGVYAIGDIAFYKGKVKMVSASAAEAGIAIHSIIRSLNG